MKTSRFLFVALSNPEKAKSDVLTALKKHGMHIPSACAAIRISKRMYYFWIKRLDLEVEIASMRGKAESEGWIHARKGRPKKANAKR